MKKYIILGVICFLLGIGLTLFIMFNIAERIMLLEDKSKYNFEETVSVFEKATLDAGWKIPIVHDLQATMLSFGKNVRKVVVYELCHPEHAYKILKEDNERVVSALMPCRIAIYEKSDGKTYISRMNSALMGQMMSGVVPEVMGVAAYETELILRSIID